MSLTGRIEAIRPPLALLLAIGLAACGESATQVSDDQSQAAAKPGGGSTTVSVTSTDPPYGYRGDTQKLVRITGSGFSPGAQASWERNGSPDPKVTVLATQFVSSTEVDATINIAADASLSFYDVAVTTNGKKGIGTELFEVTTAIPITGAGLARDANDNGQVVGRDPIYFWDVAIRVVETLNGSAGSAWGVSGDGRTVAGGVGDGSPAGTVATVWTRAGSGWTSAALPTSATAGNARGVGSDPATGAAVAIAGVETFVLKGGKGRTEPRLWLPSGSGWQIKVLPGTGGTTTGQANEVTPGLVVAGNTAGGATVWSPTGTGSWAAATIGAAGSDALSINRAGDLVVGTTGSVAVYWQRSGSSWSGPVTLPGGCARATGVDDFGRIVANGCPRPGSNVLTSVVILPPYGAADAQILNGFGDKTNGAQAEAISPLGHFIVGRVGSAAGTVGGAYWSLF